MSQEIIVSNTGSQEVVIETPVVQEFFVDGALKGDPGDPGPPGADTPVTTHSALLGLANDDHTQYLHKTKAVEQIITGPVSFTPPTGYRQIKFTIPAMLASGPENGSIHIDNTVNPGHAVSLYSNHGTAAEGAMFRMVANNAAFDKPVLEITNKGTAGSATGIRINGPRPEIEFWEDDQVSPAGAYELRVNNDKFQLGSRNATDTGFEYPVTFYREANGGYVGFGTATPTSRIDVAGKITSTGFKMTTTPTAGHVLTSDASGNATWAAAPGGGGTPATTVTDETTYGVASAVGVSTNFARQDHTHGTMATPTKTTVGLGNVDNTADTAKPVSTAQQTALDLKAPLASPTFTGTVAGITSTMVGLGNVDNTSDATERAAVATLTNKTLSSATNTFASVVSEASSATPTPTGDSRENELYETALAVGATIAAPTGTATNGNKLVIRIKDNATARTLAWNAIYRAIGVTLPTTTVASKTLYLGFKYNSADSTWDCLATGQQA